MLVTSDSDFSPLVSKLREFGKHVIGVGAVTAASARLVQVCSEYKLWDSIVARVDPPPETAQPAAQPGFRLADAQALLVAAMRQITAATSTASQIKAKMVLLDPSFDEANYGCGSFRDFLARLGHRVCTAGRSGGDTTLALVDSATNPGPKNVQGASR